MIDYLVKIIHFSLIILVLSSPFINDKKIKHNIIILLIYIISRNLTGYRKCGLTKIESYVSNKKVETGFIYKIISPFSNIEKYQFYKLIAPIQYWIFLILFYQKFNSS